MLLRTLAASRRRHSTVPVTFAILWALIAVIAFRDVNLIANTYTPHWKTRSSWGILPASLDYSTVDQYNWNLSTDQAYGSPTGRLLGKYAFFRQQIDYNYHTVYTEDRQRFQDAIIDSMLEQATFKDMDGRLCRRPQNPWIVFTAGAMGAGKSRTLKDLDGRGYFPLEAFVLVDPDQIRRQLPEFEIYVKNIPGKAGERTRREAGMIAEIAIEASLQKGYNVLVDGSLTNAAWYEEYFSVLRKAYPDLRIAILHVTAPREIVLERAMNRARVTGRVVPAELLERTMQVVPQSVAHLEPLVDFCVEIYNHGDGSQQTLGTEGLTWESFREKWEQKCADEEETVSLHVQG